MRILHTSDWHLGRTLHGVDLTEHHAAFLEHLVEVVRERAVDVVVVAGDVYDRAVPAVPSVRLLSDAFARLSDLATVIVTPGNHDSATRLGFAAGLMRPSLRILASVDDVAEPVVVTDSDGPVAFYGVPYLNPDDVRYAFGAEPLPRSHEAVMAAALAGVRDNLAGRDGARSVVVAHAFVVGGAASESERDIRVGGVDSVPTGLFDGFSYVALGHLHGQQTLRSDRAVIRYSGSPLAFSFGERTQVKSTTLIELAADGSVALEQIPAPVPRRLSEITGDLADLLDGRHDDVVDDWLRIFVTDAVHPAGLHALLRERFPHVLAIQHVPTGGLAPSERRAIAVDADPVEVATGFVEYAAGAAPTGVEIAVLRSAYERARSAEASD
ncbi:exonuclease SbcCD subunit D [Frondihabitans sp. PhB188]|uniref:metallophosphoesterase family protein n=1 Tax=Frondihabitans sp. PhB188 TaxID=2485200 RepID=UPI000F472863|nr:exonuclease SbcCD subunit D [Frondihabitans sp. PhB188]